MEHRATAAVCVCWGQCEGETPSRFFIKCFPLNTSLPQGGEGGNLCSVFSLILLLKVKIWGKECIWSQLMSCAHLLVRGEQGDSLTVVRLFPEKGEGALQKRIGWRLSKKKGMTTEWRTYNKCHRASSGLLSCSGFMERSNRKTTSNKRQRTLNFRCLIEFQPRGYSQLCPWSQPHNNPPF